MGTGRWVIVLGLALTTSLSAQSSLTERSRDTFRPTPIRGESSLEGRSLNLREAMSERRLFVLSGSSANPATSNEISSRAAQSSARLRAAQQARSRRASQVSRSVRNRRSAYRSSHTLTPAFEIPPADADYRVQKVENRMRWLTHAEERLGAADLDIQWLEGRALLTGTVRKERDLRLLEQMLLLEPGVREVDNRLVLASEER